MQKDETERGAGGGGKREPARAGGPRSEVRAGRAGDGRACGSRRPLGAGAKPSQSWSKLVKAALFYFFWGGGGAGSKKMEWWSVGVVGAS